MAAQSDSSDISKQENPEKPCLDLYHYPLSMFSIKAVIALKERELKFNSHFVNLFRKENYQPWYVKLNPKAKIPVLKVGDQVINESDEIIRYVDKNYSCEKPPLIPDEKSKDGARVKHFMTTANKIYLQDLTYGAILHPELTSSFATTKLKFVNTKVKSIIKESEQILRNYGEANPELKSTYLELAERKSDQLSRLEDKENVEKLLKELDTVLDEVEKELEQRKKDFPEKESWLCGETFTGADISIGTLLHGLTKFGYSKTKWGEGKRPQIEHYYQQFLERPSVKSANRGGLRGLALSAVTEHPVVTALISVGIIAAIGGGVGLFMCKQK